MLKFVSGDILLTKAEGLAHGVAPNDDFHQGLALSLREQWPALYKDFKHYCKTRHPKEGGLWSWKGPESPVIINLLTQEHPPKDGARPGPASLKHVNHSLKALAREAKEQGLKSLAITRLATGVGGLSWEDVKPLIEEHLSDVGIPVVVYETFHKGQQAAEGLNL